MYRAVTGCGEHVGSSGQLLVTNWNEPEYLKTLTTAVMFLSVQLDTNPGSKFSFLHPTCFRKPSPETTPSKCDLDPLRKPPQRLSHAWRIMKKGIIMLCIWPHDLAPANPLVLMQIGLQTARNFQIPTCALLFPPLGLAPRLLPFLRTLVPPFNLLLFIWRTPTHPSGPFLRKAYTECQLSALAVPCTQLPGHFIFLQ